MDTCYKFPQNDVLVRTADPSKEPSLGVMNTVISATALDYPPDKLAVYLSDDGGSWVTLQAVREAWKFAKCWLPFRRKYRLKNRCPQAYFSAAECVDDEFITSKEFLAEKREIERRYQEFKESLEKDSVNASSSVSRDNAPIIEMTSDENGNAVDSIQQEMPILVYVSWEKRPSQPHHFKAGALNALMRVSAVINNAPYILFPQKFHNVREHDLYNGRLFYYWNLLRGWLGLDGLGGPLISGCNLYMKREALYGTKNINSDIDLNQLKKCFGSSNE